MLKGDALSYYAANYTGCNSYEEAIGVLRRWYNSDDKQTRILTRWQSMTLSKAMSDPPEESDVNVFRKFVAASKSLQNQLDVTYHDDKSLRDRFLTVVDIASIQTTLRDRMPSNSHDAVNRVAKQLSNKPNSAGSNATCMVEYDRDEANYSLGKSYGEEAKRDVKSPWKKEGNYGGRRLNSSWMRGVKGCFVYGADHMARTNHSREEVKTAINKLKAKYPQTLLTIEDLSAVVNMTIDD